jgi:hypothetical protein
MPLIGFEASLALSAIVAPFMLPQSAAKRVLGLAYDVVQKDKAWHATRSEAPTHRPKWVF